MIEQKYYENYFNLFVSEGWKQFLQDVTEQHDAIELLNAKNWDEFLVMKTSKQFFKNIINFELMLKMHFENEKNSDTDVV